MSNKGWLVILGLVHSTYCCAQDTVVLETIKSGFASNVSLFQKYRSEYTYETGVVLFAKDSTTPVFKKSAQAQCIHFQCRDCGFLDVKTTREIPGHKPQFAHSKSSEGNGFSPAELDRKSIFLDNRSLHYNPALKLLAYRESDSQYEYPVPIPMHFFGNRTNSSDLDVRFFKNSGVDIIYRGIVRIGDDDCHHIVSQAKHDPKQWTSVYFSPSKGYLPMRREVYNDGILVYITEILRAKHVDGRAWYPETVLRREHGRDGEKLASRLQTSRVELLDNCQCDSNHFTVPAGTQVNHQDDGAFFVLRQDEHVSPSDLEEIQRKLIATKTNPNKSIDTTIKHTGQKSLLWFWILGTLGILLVGYGGYRWFRSRKRV